MKKYLLAILAGLLLCALPAELIDRIVGKVGSEVILMSDVYKQMLQMQSAGVPKENLSTAAVLRNLIEQKVIFQKAKELNLTVDEKKIQNYAERYLQQIKSRYPDEAAFTADLAAEKLTESDLLDYYKDLLREKAMSDQLVERYVTSKISVDNKEMEDFYTVSKDTLAVKPVTWDIGLIMYEIKPSKESEDAKLAEIRQIKQRLDKGEDFATLAKEVSDCPSSDQGGDLGFFSRGMMVKPFEDAAFALNVGEMSDIVRTQYGFHIIKVEEKRANEIRARHILKVLNPTSADTLAAHQLMENVRAQYLAGTASFSDLAKQYSADPEVKTNNGIIGEMSAAEFPELFSEQIQALSVGGITPVLENEGLLYLFAKLREIPSRVYAYDEVKDKLKDYLFTQKQMKAYDEWIDKLIFESYVKIVE